MNTENSLQKMQPLDLAAPSPAQMLHAILEKGVTADNVVAIEKLAELSWKFEQRDAERKFNAAFVALQSQLPTIVASSVIPNRGKYERFEDIMRQIENPLSANGFSVSFTQELTDNNRVVVTCNLSHIGGHSRKNSIAVRVSGRADSETQADCKATTTAKRNSLIQALNLVIRQDVLNEENDAAIEGDPNEFITEKQAAEIEHRAKMLACDIPALFRFCGCDSFKTIPARKLDELDSMLARKERAGK